MLWFYIVPERQMPLLDALAMPWQVVHKDNRQSWVAVIDPEEPPRDALPVPRTHTGACSLRNSSNSSRKPSWSWRMRRPNVWP